ncbi:hypothetical protein MHU86_1936 [Fragilaria crotonensis]|nr:hypothetical protein MHU86_1936 [Fragilaria crotonensis]
MRLTLPSLALLLSASDLVETVYASDAGGVSEIDILQEFYQATNGESWNSNDGWEDNTADYCSWFGVVCESEESELDDPSRNLITQDDEKRNRRKLSSATIPDNQGGKVIALQLKKTTYKEEFHHRFGNFQTSESSF